MISGDYENCMMAGDGERKLQQLAKSGLKTGADPSVGPPLLSFLSPSVVHASWGRKLAFACKGVIAGVRVQGGYSLSFGIGPLLSQLSAGCHLYRARGCPNPNPDPNHDLTE